MGLLSSALNLIPASVTQANGLEYGLVSTPGGRKLAILGHGGSADLSAFAGDSSDFEDQVIVLCRLTGQNAMALRDQLAWLRPKPLGMSTSFGMGDRLGVATPGHARAMGEFEGRIAPIFAQQSTREMRRTGRTPQQVMDEATWGIFEAGWQGGIGADADHLKSTEEIDQCWQAGFSFFTFDPGAYVRQVSGQASKAQLTGLVDELPDYLHTCATDLLGESLDFDGHSMVISEGTLLSAIVKYGKAIDQVVTMYRHLEMLPGTRPFEVEISMDETEEPTTPAEHVYIAHELRRMGVKWASFAPRFTGRFEKGVDYIGDIQALEAELSVHAAIARQYGPYKLSLHSGSDKLSIYPLFAQKTNGLVHVKTAGTSYLEALRTIAGVDRELMAEIYNFALTHYSADRQSYHVSAVVERAPKPSDIKDWSSLLDQFDAREILHVTFGSVLTEKTSPDGWRFYDQILQRLETYREEYFNNLVKHFRQHLRPFATL